VNHEHNQSKRQRKGKTCKEWRREELTIKRKKKVSEGKIMTLKFGTRILAFGQSNKSTHTKLKRCTRKTSSCMHTPIPGNKSGAAQCNLRPKTKF